MLPPEPHAVWLIPMLIVVFTRDFSAPFLPVFVIFQVVVWMSSEANQLPTLEMFNFDVRRVSYMLYGAVSGLALASAMNTRDLIPVHTFAHKRLHLAGPLSLVAVSYGTYALATATGITRIHEDFGDWTDARPGEIAIFSILFILFVLLFGASLVMTWIGTKSFLAYRYRDSGIEVNGYPPSRIIVEFILAITLLIAPHLFWIYLTHPPVNLDQWIGGVIALLLEHAVWGGIYFWFAKRHNMSTTYFSRHNAYITWPGFILAMGTVHIGSCIIYVTAAQFLVTPLANELLMIGITAYALTVAVIVWLWPESKLRRASKVRDQSLVAPDAVEESTIYRPVVETERTKRLRDLGLVVG